MRLEVSQIRQDGGTQARAALNLETIAEYAQAMQQGHPFPAVVVFFDGTDYWLVDGFHRVEAVRMAGFREIEVELKLGSKREAILYAVGANATYGLRRSPADKHQAVSLLLQDEEWGQWSDRGIAKQTRTSHPFVAKVRREFTGNVSSERVYRTRHGTMTTMETHLIGQGQGQENYSLALPPSLWEQLQGYQERSGLASLEESLGKLLATQLPRQTGEGERGQRWLGLDPGLAVVGWAVLEEEEAGAFPILVDYGTIQTNRRHSTSQRLWELEQDLGEILREFHPGEIALEMPLQVNPQASRGVLQAMGVIHLVCYRGLGKSPVMLYPATWKAHLGNGRADAEEVALMLETLFGLPAATRSRLDAVGIAYAGLSGVRSGE